MEEHVASEASPMCLSIVLCYHVDVVWFASLGFTNRPVALDKKAKPFSSNAHTPIWSAWKWISFLICFLCCFSLFSSVRLTSKPCFSKCSDSTSIAMCINKSPFHSPKFSAVSASRVGHLAVFEVSFAHFPATLIARACALRECCFNRFDFAWIILATFFANCSCFDVAADALDELSKSLQTCCKCSSAADVASASSKTSLTNCSNVLSGVR